MVCSVDITFHLELNIAICFWNFVKRTNPRMMFKLIVLLFVVSSCSGEANDEAIGNANFYVDEVLENLRNETWLLSKLDPLDIPEVTDKNFEIKQGQVKGLSSLYRHGDCTLDYDGETVVVTAEVAVRDVRIEVKYAAKALFFWIKGHATVDVNDLAVRMNLTGNDGRAHLESFKVTKLGDYKVRKITGMSVVLNWLLKLIVNTVASKSRSKIINAMETGVAKAVGDLLEKYQLPKLSK